MLPPQKRIRLAEFSADPAADNVRPLAALQASGATPSFAAFSEVNVGQLTTLSAPLSARCRHWAQCPPLRLTQRCFNSSFRPGIRRHAVRCGILRGEGRAAWACRGGGLASQAGDAALQASGAMPAFAARSEVYS